MVGTLPNAPTIVAYPSSKNTLDPMVELVCLAFTRARLFPNQLKPGQDPMESMVIVRGVSMSNSESVAQKMLAPLLECPHIDKAEVRVELAPTSMSEEYGGFYPTRRSSQLIHSRPTCRQSAWSLFRSECLVGR